MRVVTLLSFALGVVVGRATIRTDARRSNASTAPPAPNARDQPTSPVLQFDLPRWGQRISATSEGLFDLRATLPLSASPTVSLIYASFLQARHDTDDLGDALHDFGVRTNGGPDYGQLLVSLGQASLRLGSNLAQDVLNNPGVQQAANAISTVGTELKEAVNKTKLPTSTVENFNRAIDLVGAFAGLFGR